MQTQAQPHAAAAAQAACLMPTSQQMFQTQASLNAIMNQPIQQVELVQVPYRSAGYLLQSPQDQSVSGSTSQSANRKRRPPPIRTPTPLLPPVGSPLQSPKSTTPHVLSPNSIMSPLSTPVCNAPIMPAPQSVSLSAGTSTAPIQAQQPTQSLSQSLSFLTAFRFKGDTTFTGTKNLVTFVNNRSTISLVMFFAFVRFFHCC